MLMFFRHEFWKIQQTDSKAKMWKLVRAGWIIPKPSGLFLVCVHWLWNSVHLIYGVHLSPLLLPTDSCPWFWEGHESWALSWSSNFCSRSPSPREKWSYFLKVPGINWALRKLHKKGQVWVWVSNLNSMIYSQHLVSTLTKSHFPCVLAF